MTETRGNTNQHSYQAHRSAHPQATSSDLVPSLRLHQPPPAARPGPLRQPPHISLDHLILVPSHLRAHARRTRRSRLAPTSAAPIWWLHRQSFHDAPILDRADLSTRGSVQILTPAARPARLTSPESKFRQTGSFSIGLTDHCSNRPVTSRDGRGAVHHDTVPFCRSTTSRRERAAPALTSQTASASCGYRRGAGARVVRRRAPRSWPGNPNGQSATWEPMMTVRSAGSPKWSIALDALRAIAMNRFLRQRCMPGASVGVIVIRETK